MRWVLALAFCAAVAATTWAGLREEPALRVTIHDAMPFSDPEDDQNALGNRYWDVAPRITVEPRCAGLRTTTASRVLFNGERVSEREVDATAGDTVRISAKARCRDGSNAEATRDFQLPTASCDAGPIRVFELQGSAASWDWNHEDRRMTLHEGDLVAPGSALRVEPGGRVELGAPECNGFRAVLVSGDYSVGGYESRGRGDTFGGRRILAKGDRHAGGFYVEAARPPASVKPLGERATSYEVRSTPVRVTVRVYLGDSVLVHGTSERAKGVRVRVGQQTSVLCSTPSHCVPTSPRLFHPNEPWTTAPNARLRPVPQSVAGANPPLTKLAPQFAHVEARRLPAAGGAPAQIFVRWSREIRVRPGRAQVSTGRARLAAGRLRLARGLPATTAVLGRSRDRRRRRHGGRSR